MELVETRTLGDAWLEVARRIVERGNDASWGGAPTREVALLTLVVAEPDPSDSVIAALGDPDWLRWMHENFFVPKAVDELGGADSYAVRLFDYDHSGRNQVAWVVQRLRDDPECRDATITTFQPHTDTAYIPCVSLLDFWLPDEAGSVGGQAADARPGNRLPAAARAVELVVYAHGLDFGKKAYGNLVELAALQAHVARELDASIGRLVLHVKTAHVYEPELALMRELSSAAARPA
jgi:thymidylate synthase